MLNKEKKHQKRKLKQKINKENNMFETLDLHGTKHENAYSKVYYFITINNPPFRIVTGHSRKMKSIVFSVLNRCECSFHYELNKNEGSIIVDKCILDAKTATKELK